MLWDILTAFVVLCVVGFFVAAIAGWRSGMRQRRRQVLRQVDAIRLIRRARRGPR